MRLAKDEKQWLGILEWHGTNPNFEKFFSAMLRFLIILRIGWISGIILALKVAHLRSQQPQGASCTDKVYSSVQNIPCACPSATYKIGSGSGTADGTNFKEYRVENLMGVHTIDLGRRFDKVNYRDEDRAKVEMTMLTKDDMYLLENAGDISLELETDLFMEVHSQRSHNPSHIIVRKLSNIKDKVKVSIISTSNNPNIIARLRYVEGNHFTCEDISQTASSTPTLICSGLSKGVNKPTNSRVGSHVLLNRDSYIVESFLFDPRGPGASTHQNRWKFNRFSLKLSKYNIRLKVKNCGKSVQPKPTPFKPHTPDKPHTASSANTKTTLATKPPTVATYEPSKSPLAEVPSPATGHHNRIDSTSPTKPPKHPQDDGQCGRVHLTEADKEFYYLTQANTSAPLPPPLPTTTVTTHRSSNQGKSCVDDSIPSQDCSINNPGDEINEMSNLGHRERIVGGTASMPGAWPWQISIRYISKHDCGGALINNLWLLSAQHCFNKGNQQALTLSQKSSSTDAETRKAREFYDRYTLHLGTVLKNGKSETEQIRKIQEVIPYPDYAKAKKYDNDIILIKMDKPVEITKYVSPICISHDKVLNTTSLCMVTGYGKTLELGEEGILNELSLLIVEQGICASKDWLYNRLTDNMFCAGGTGNKDSCQGDSGGPFMCLDELTSNWNLVGIVSWGIHCGLVRRPGVYARVARYATWIESHIK